MALIEPTAGSYRENGRLISWNPSPLGQAKGHPAIANGRPYIRKQNGLWYYDVKEGKWIYAIILPIAPGFCYAPT